MLSDYSALNVDINRKRNYRNHINTWKLNNLLSTWSVIKETKELILKFLQFNERE